MKEYIELLLKEIGKTIIGFCVEENYLRVNIKPDIGLTDLLYVTIDLITQVKNVKSDLKVDNIFIVSFDEDPAFDIFLKSDL